MNRKLLAGSVLLGGLVLGLSEEEPRWSRSVADFMGRPIHDRTVRLEGTLVPNTLCKVPDRCEHRFKLRDRYAEPAEAALLPVRYESCVIPDTFREVPGLEVSVTIQGKMCSGCHTFDADMIMAKCPGKYEMYRDGGGPHLGATPLKTCNARGEPNM